MLFNSEKFLVRLDSADKLVLRRALTKMLSWPVFDARTETGRRVAGAQLLLDKYKTSKSKVDWCASSRAFLKKESYCGTDEFINLLDEEAISVK
jgi:hypothetical protein